MSHVEANSNPTHPMSDQPKPATDEQIPVTKGLTYHFKAGRDEPKMHTTGEWTARVVKNEPFTGCRVAIGNKIISGNLFPADAENLVEAINAALAAAYEKGKQDGRDESEISVVEGPTP